MKEMLFHLFSGIPKTEACKKEIEARERQVRERANEEIAAVQASRLDGTKAKAPFVLPLTEKEMEQYRKLFSYAECMQPSRYTPSEEAFKEKLQSDNPQEWVARSKLAEEWAAKAQQEIERIKSGALPAGLSPEQRQAEQRQRSLEDMELQLLQKKLEGKHIEVASLEDREKAITQEIDYMQETLKRQKEALDVDVVQHLEMVSQTVEQRKDEVRNRYVDPLGKLEHALQQTQKELDSWADGTAEARLRQEALEKRRELQQQENTLKNYHHIHRFAEELRSDLKQCGVSETMWDVKRGYDITVWKEQDERRVPVSLIDELERIAGQETVHDYAEIKKSFCDVLRTNEVVTFQDPTSAQLVKLGVEPNADRIVASAHQYPTQPQPLKGWEKFKSKFMRLINRRSDGDLRYERQMAEYQATRPQAAYHEKKQNELLANWDRDDLDFDSSQLKNAQKHYVESKEHDHTRLWDNICELEGSTEPARERAQMEKTQLTEAKNALLQKQQDELDKLTQEFDRSKVAADKKCSEAKATVEQEMNRHLQKANEDLPRQGKLIAEQKESKEWMAKWTAEWAAGAKAIAAKREQRREGLEKQLHQKEQKVVSQGTPEKTAQKEASKPVKTQGMQK